MVPPRTLCKALPILVLAGCLAGCDGTQDERYLPAPKLVRGRVMHVEDVPLPVGFKKLARSYMTMSGTSRNCCHYYEGRAPRQSVLNFYRDQMPPYGWTEVTYQDVDDEYTLRYETPLEQCEIRIWNAGEKAKVRVVIQPRIPGPSPGDEDQES